MGTYCGKCDKKFDADDYDEDNWDEKDEHYVCLPCVKISDLESRVNPDMTNAQYHSMLDILWKALPKRFHKVTNDTVFEKVSSYIKELEDENEQLREIIEYSGIEADELLSMEADDEH